MQKQQTAYEFQSLFLVFSMTQLASRAAALTKKF